MYPGLHALNAALPQNPRAVVHRRNPGASAIVTVALDAVIEFGLVVRATGQGIVVRATMFHTRGARSPGSDTTRTAGKRRWWR